MCNSRFKVNETLTLKKWLSKLTTVLLFFLLSSWAVYARGQDNISFAVISDHRNYFQGLETALEFIDTQNVDFILVLGDFDPIEDGYTNYYSIHYKALPYNLPVHSLFYSTPSYILNH